MLPIFFLLQKVQVVQPNTLLLVYSRQNNTQSIKKRLQSIRVVYLGLYPMRHEQNSDDLADIGVQVGLIRILEQVVNLAVGFWLASVISLV